MKIFIFLFASTCISLGQDTTNTNLVFWSSTRKLSLSDFGIKTSNSETSTSFAQFTVDYKVSGFDFMTKNFNKRVRNYLIRSASTIDTTVNVSTSLQYQQTLFDLCEIYTRQFRKELKANRKKITSGTQFVDGINQKVMTDFANRRVIYDRETNFGSISEKQIEWEKAIAKELTDLMEFSNE
jgi:hypothetical protein